MSRYKLSGRCRVSFPLSLSSRGNGKRAGAAGNGVGNEVERSGNEGQSWKRNGNEKDEKS